MTTQKTKLEKIAESQNLVFFSLFIILIPIMMHTAHLLLSVSIIKSEFYAYFFAIGFDLAIFIFAAHGRTTAAGGIAVIVFILNASVLNLDTLNNQFNPALVKLIITTILASTSAWILHSYVMMFNEQKTERNKIMDLYASIHQKDIEINKLKTEIDNIKANNKKYEEEIQKLTHQNNTANQKTTNAFVSETFIQLDDRVICKLCNNTFENIEKYNHYKNRYCAVPNCKSQNNNEEKKSLTLSKPSTSS